MDLESLREHYLHELPRYETLAKRVELVLRAVARDVGMVCRFDSRAKEVDSFLKKALVKFYADPYEEIRDKAGARVIAPFYAQVEELEWLIRERFFVEHHENKRSALSYDQLGYLGVHFEVRLRPEDLGEGEGELGELVCEIQLHTGAQSAWAEVSHDLLYKPAGGSGPSDEHQRSVYRLVAFVEVFDEEAGRARDAMMTREGFGEAWMLGALERPFARLSARGFDRELSLRILGMLGGLYEPEELERFPGLVGDFVERTEGKLTDLFAQYREDNRRNPLLFQPETIAVFERLEANAFTLREAWNEILPEDLLDGLAAIWGVPA